MQFFRLSSSSPTTRSSSLFVASSASSCNQYLSSSIRCCSSSSAAASTQSSSSASTTDENARFLAFHNTSFVLSPIDYCAKLAEEANVKHNVPLNVPPQACPTTYDHSVVYCPLLEERTMNPSGFSYPIQFEPPPKHIPGMETPKSEHLQRAAAANLVLQQKIKAGAGAATTTPGKTTTVIDAADISSSKKTIGKLISPADQNPFKMQKYSDIHNVGGDGVKSETFDEYVRKMKKNALDLDYPTDDEIDTLLLQVWDPVVSKRVPEFVKQNPKFTFKEAKDYTIVDVASEDMKASRMKVAESVLRGESSRPRQAGVDPEHQVHFETPFTMDSSLSSMYGDEDAMAATGKLSPPKLSKYSDRRAFSCSECTFTFRTYDALKTHFMEAHKKPLPVMKDLEYRDAALKQQNSANVSTSSNSLLAMKLQLAKEKLQAREQLKKQQAMKDATSSASSDEEAKAVDSTTIKNEGAAESDVTSNSNDVNDNISSSNSTNKQGTLTGEAAIRATPLPEVDISLHSRSPFNIQLLGIVRQVQTGYAGRDYVAELLVETQYEEADENMNNNTESSTDVKNEKTSTEKDVFTVRCFGEEFANMTANSIEEGSTTTRVMIQGTYKSNLHVDRTSGKPQCFPFVKVVPPYGTVVILPSSSSSASSSQQGAKKRVV